MVACRYGIPLPVLNFISHSFTVLTDEVSRHSNTLRDIPYLHTSTHYPLYMKNIKISLWNYKSMTINFQFYITLETTSVSDSILTGCSTKLTVSQQRHLVSFVRMPSKISWTQVGSVLQFCCDPPFVVPAEEMLLLLLTLLVLLCLSFSFSFAFSPWIKV